MSPKAHKGQNLELAGSNLSCFLGSYFHGGMFAQLPCAGTFIYVSAPNGEFLRANSKSTNQLLNSKLSVGITDCDVFLNTSIVIFPCPNVCPRYSRLRRMWNLVPLSCLNSFSFVGNMLVSTKLWAGQLSLCMIAIWM